MKKTNKEWYDTLNLLFEVSDKKGKLGYAIARNIRLIQNEIKEFLDLSESLLQKYGEEELNDEGKKTGRLVMSVFSENADLFEKEIEQVAAIENDVKVFMVEPEDAMEQLTAREMLWLEFMIEGAYGYSNEERSL